jgi:hypothetical protein
MFRSPFTNFTYAGSGCPGRAARRAAARAASLAAISLLMLGTRSGPAVAQVTNTPLRAYFTNLLCLDQSDDNTWPFPDHDEPYVVIFAADLRGGAVSGRVLFSQIFDDVDKNESRSDMLQVWAPDGNSAPINSANDYVILVALMEEDSSSYGFGPVRDLIRSQLYKVMLPKLQAYKQSGLSRPAMISNLRADMTQAIDASRVDDDRVGEVFDLVWTPSSLDLARAGQPVDLRPTFIGSDSSYQLTFRLQ